MMKKLILGIGLLTLAACSSQRVIVDQRYSDMSNYSRDLAECQSYADQVPTGEEVAKGTMGGAVIGGALGAIVGDSGTAKRGAGAGALGGAVRGGSKSKSEKDRVIKNCLRNRGYKVLN